MDNNANMIRDELKKIQGLVQSMELANMHNSIVRINRLINKIDDSRNKIKGLMDEIDYSMGEIRNEISKLKEKEEEAVDSCNDANAKLNIVCSQYFSYECKKLGDSENGAIDALINKFIKLRKSYDEELNNWLDVKDNNMFYGIESRFIRKLYECFEIFSQRVDMRDIIERVQKSEEPGSEFYQALEALRNDCDKDALTDKEKRIYEVLNDLRDNYEKICNGEKGNNKWEIDFPSKNGDLFENEVCVFPGIKKIQISSGENKPKDDILVKPKFEKLKNLKGEQ